MSEIQKNLGHATAYGYAKSKGYTGTEEEFAELMADYAAVGQRAEQAATAAAASATAASGSASDSADSATAAEGFAGNASTAAGNASQAAQNASQSASAASGSATAAGQSATAAAGSATTAGDKASEAAQSATEAAASATTAGTAATNAQTAQTAAETAQGAAEDAAESVEGKAAQIDQNTEDISLLKSHLNDLANNDQEFIWFNEASVSGTRSKSYTTVIPAGEYVLTVGALTSSDTQYTNSRIIFSTPNGNSSHDIPRGDTPYTKTITLPGNTTGVTFYGAHNYSDSAGTTFTYSNVTLKQTTQLKEKLDSLESDSSALLTEVRSLKIDATPTTTAPGTFIYYPMDFIPGQTYIAKIKFTAFSSTANRKYSLRTTTGQYSSDAYRVQIIAEVNGTNPVIGKEYTYIFEAIERSAGMVGRYLALELNPSSGQTATCELKVYSVKAEDVQTQLNKLNYLTATDIVSLNHDVPSKVLNGLKPFNRATQVPFALLHFSDIHGNGTNLERIVAMGSHLGTDIDDVICTGDMVTNNYSATGMDFWNSVSGAENVLMVVGNHDLADGQHGYSSDQIGQTVAYQTYFAPYVSNWGVTMAGTNLTYWYKDYATKKVRLIGLNYLLTEDESAAQKTWLAARLAEAKTAGYTVVIAEHSPLNAFIEIPCNFDIIGKAWGYNEIKADIQSAVQDFIDDGGEFACYIAGHSHSDYVGYNSNFPDQLCIVVTTALTTGADNDQRRVVGEKSQDAANVVLVDTVTKTVKLVRVGADMDTYLRGRNLFSIRYTDKTVIAQS